MTPTQAQIEAAKILGHLKALYVADDDPKHDPFAIEIIATALTAAAEAGDETLPQALVVDFERREQWKRDAETIERCAQRLDELAKIEEESGNAYGAVIYERAAAAIRALKDSK